MAFQRIRSGMARRGGTCLLPALALAVAACDENRATFFEPVGGLAYTFGMTATPERLPGGSITILGTDTLVLDISWLRALQGGGTYQVWGVTRDAAGKDVYTTLGGRLTEYRLKALLATNGDTIRDKATDNPVLVTDSTVVATAGANAYVGSDSTREVVTGARFVLTTAGNAGVNPTAQHAIVVAIQPGGAGATPGAAQVLWRRIAVIGGGSLSFGNFGGSYEAAGTSPRDHIFRASGAATGAIRGPEISIRFTNLPRPPRGFFYRVWLVDVAGKRTIVDTLRSDFSLVPDLSRQSLLDADQSPYLPGVSGNGILAAAVRNCVAGSTDFGCANKNTLALTGSPPFGSIESVVLQLSPKLASPAASQSVVLSGAIPDPARAGK